MRIGAVVAAGLVTVAVALVLVLLDSGQRQAGSNYVPELSQAVTIKSTGSHCQGGQLIPADAASLRLLVGTYENPTPKLSVTVRAGGKAIAAGTLPAGRTEGHLTIPIDPVDEPREDATVCVDVKGAAERRTVFYGTLGQLRFEWLRDGSETWLELLPTVAHRFGLGKPFVSGSWVLALAALLLGLAWAAALRLLMRDLRG